MNWRGICSIAGVLLLLWHYGGDIPIPGPGPSPDVVVEDKPPFKADKLSVLIVQQTEDVGKLTKEQREILQNSTELRRWVKSNGADFRQFDADEDGQFLDQKWKAALAVPRQSLPWLVVANPKAGFSGPLPSTLPETLALLEKFKP